MYKVPYVRFSKVHLASLSTQRSPRTLAAMNPTTAHRRRSCADTSNKYQLHHSPSSPAPELPVTSYLYIVQLCPPLPALCHAQHTHTHTHTPSEMKHLLPTSRHASTVSRKPPIVTTTNTIVLCTSVHVLTVYVCRRLENDSLSG